MGASADSDKWRWRCSTTGIAKRCGEIAERRDRRRVAPGAGGDDHRPLRLGKISAASAIAASSAPGGAAAARRDGLS